MAGYRAIDIAPFDELAEPGRVVELAVAAEERGWDGFFVWDHLIHRPPVRAVADPWVTLAAVAVETRRVRIGPMITPVARRRPHQLARETVTLDRLSEGRLVLGVGLGADGTGEFDPSRFGEEGDPRARARLLDAGLERLVAYWGGELEPAPIQQPRIPVWVATRYPNRRPLARALRFDGLFPIDLPGPEALAEYAAELTDRGAGIGEGFDLVVSRPPGSDPAPWFAAGATWVLTEIGPQPTFDEVMSAIEALETAS